VVAEIVEELLRCYTIAWRRVTSAKLPARDCVRSLGCIDSGYLVPLEQLSESPRSSVRLVPVLRIERSSLRLCDELVSP
jgi:hypothetical protein